MIKRSVFMLDVHHEGEQPLADITYALNRAFNSARQKMDDKLGTATSELKPMDVFDLPVSVVHVPAMLVHDRFVLVDASSEDNAPKITGQFQLEGRHHHVGAIFKLDGFGLYDVQDYGGVICLEHFEGRPQLLVWADINQEDPTHVIDLSGAMEMARVEEVDGD